MYCTVRYLLLLLPTKPCPSRSPQSPVPASQTSPRQRYRTTSLPWLLEAWLLCSLRLCARATLLNLSRHAKRLHRAALPPPGPWLAIVSNDKREDLRLQLAVRFNCLFLPPTACVSTNNHLLRRAPTPIQTVPLPISLATNIEGSLSLLIWTNAPSHQSRLQISETHCGPPACPRAKAKKKERNG
jgi:hypothetical protein